MQHAMTRVLKLQSNGTEVDVSVRIFWPIEEATAWDCRWEIDWPDRQRANSGRGVDSIQALMQALNMVGAEVYSAIEFRSGRLSWHPGWSGCGFPVPGNIRDLLIGDDAKFL